MTTYNRLLRLIARDRVLMLGDLARLRPLDGSSRLVVLCIDDDGLHADYTLVASCDNHGYYADRVCGACMLTPHTDLSDALDFILEQCLSQVYRADV